MHFLRKRAVCTVRRDRKRGVRAKSLYAIVIDGPGPLTVRLIKPIPSTRM